MKRIVIVGASGHGKVVADIAALNGYTDIVFLDDDTSVKECGGYPVVGKSTEVPDTDDLFVAIGNANMRKKLMEQQYKGKKFPVLIHPNAVIARGVEIGEGSVIMPGVVINPGAQIGRGVIVNTASSADHDCVLGNYVHLAVSSHLCGTVTVKDGTWVGAGAIVRNNINICGGCMIGAGAVVVKDIDEPGTYVGVPARKVENG